MNWLKRNPRLGSVLLLGGLALAAEAWLWREARQQAARAQAGLAQKKQERDRLERQTPALSPANEKATAQDLDQAAGVLAGLRAALQGRDGKMPAGPPPSKPIDLYFDIATFVERTRALAARAQVRLRPDERFGFAAQANEGPVADLVPAVHRQRQLAQFLVEALLEAHPRDLLSVQRERPLTAAQRNSAGQPDGPGGTAPPDGDGAGSDFFAWDARDSLRLPGRIESDAFRLEFTGQTPALRAWLNSLASAPMPVIVRRVEVERLTTEPPAAVAAAAGAPVPLVARNFSKFTVVVECAELLPAPEAATP